MDRFALVLAIACAAACAPPPPPPAPPSAPVVRVPIAPPPPSALPAPPPSLPASDEPTDGPPPPAKRPIDPALVVDGAGLFLGATAREAWLVFEGYTVVVDKTTGCATESYPEPDVLKKLGGVNDVGSVARELERADVLRALRDLVGLGRRFGPGGHRFLLDLVWSGDGRFIYFIAASRLFRSGNGGRSFALVDDQPSSRLAMSLDGKHLVYERCAGATCGYVSLRTDGSTEPVPLTHAQTFFLRMTADGRAIFTRSEAEICADTFDLESGAPTSVCVPFPAKATGVWPSREWVSISPSGRYGVVKWEEGRPNLAGAIALTYVVSLVDMPSARILKTVTNMLGDVDDEGNMVLSSVSEGGGDHTYFLPRTGAQRLLGHHSLFQWDGKIAALSVWKKATLGRRRCDLLKLVPAP